MSSQVSHGEVHEREIEEDVMNVPFIAWLGAVATILIAVLVLLLMGVYYLTQRQETARRWEQAGARVTDLEAQLEVDRRVVDGYFRHPAADEVAGDRPKVNVPVSIGMQKVVEEFGK